MLHTKAIIRVIAHLLLLETVLLAVCSGVSFYCKDSALLGFALSTLITGLSGGGLFIATQKSRGWNDFTRRDGYVIVTFSWLAFAAFGMLPFLLSGCIPSLADAFFESMSGISSTGATIMDNIDTAPRSILFWRSLTQWFGGLGIILFTIAILPFFGVSGLQMFAAEVSGPMHSKVKPRIGSTARWIWMVYVGLTILLAYLLTLGDMSLFDSVCHAMTTVGSGGFSTHQDSIAYYQSPCIEYILIPFMFIAGVNFNLLLLLTTGKFKKIWRDNELRWYTSVVLLTALFLTAILYLSNGMGAEEALRKSLFQVVSLQTSTGFSTDDYASWPAALSGILLVIMMTGACAGSTTGGLKCIRVKMLIKVVSNEFTHILHPNAVLPVKLNRQVVRPTLVATVTAFCMLYFCILFVSSILLTFMGIDMLEAIGCAISALGNMGPALGTYGPSSTWSSMPDTGKWLISALMLLGRLELFTVLLLFTPKFWKKN